MEADDRLRNVNYPVEVTEMRGKMIEQIRQYAEARQESDTAHAPTA